MSRLACLLTLLFYVCATPAFSSEDFESKGWAHIELGAGNYGPDGHTKASQAMTVLQRIGNVSAKPNYIDELEEEGRGEYNAEEQYSVLFWTLDEMVRRHGELGIFHVNDLYEEYADFAAQKLMEYAIAKGYESVMIESVSGDYQEIDPAAALSNL